MPNNTTLNPGTGGDIIQTIDNTSYKTQVMALGDSSGVNIAQVDSTGLVSTITPDIITSGSISSATSLTSSILSNRAVSAIQVSGNGIGTLQFQISVDGTNFISVPFLNTVSGSQIPVSGLIFASAGSLNGIYQVDVSGIQFIRVSCTAFTSGTFNITIRSSTATGVVALDAPLPTGTNSIGLVDFTPYTITGTLDATVLNSTVTLNGLNGMVPSVLAVLGTFATATMTFETSVDNGTTWFATSAINLSNNSVTATTQTAGARELIPTLGCTNVRVRTSIVGTGTPTHILRATTVHIPPMYGSTGNSVSDAATIGSFQNVYNYGFTYNGTTWDKVRAGVGVSTGTGDSGAKTTTGTGVINANLGSKGIQILINLGAVTGTSPTIVFKIQCATDGANFFDVPGATTATLTASGFYGITVAPGVTPVAGVATTGTTTVAAAVLTRSWRVAWTIGGTTPSFTITGINFNYIAA